MIARGLHVVVAVAVGAGRTGAQTAPVVVELGSEACPCIDPWSATSYATAEAAATFETDQCRPATHAGRNRNGPTTSCLPPDYGASRCSTWDMLLSPECVNAQGEVPDSGQPDWCQSSWCYVDPANCARPFSTSSMSWPTVTGLPEDGLAYSYETCGNVDSYSASKHYESLSGMHLKVSYPGDSSTGYTLFTNEGRKDGAFVKFMQDIAADAGFTWEVHNVSEASKSRFSSSYTACVHEVALGETDLCIGNFWMTSARLLLASFGPNIYNDEFRLVVMAEDKVDYWALMATPFKPFTVSAWIWITALVGYMSLAMYIMEPEEVDIEDNESLLDRITDLIGIKNDNYPFLAMLDKTLTSIAKCLYNGLMAFTSGAPVQEAQSFPSRVISSGFAAFGLIILTAYTASSAAALVADATSSSINSIDDVIAMGPNVKVCVRSASESLNVFGSVFYARTVMDSLLQRYPTLNLLGQDQVDDMIVDLEAGNCVAAVVMNEAWIRQLVANPEHCKKRVVGATLITQGNAMPIADRLQMPLSYLMARHLAAGAYHDLRDSYRNEYVGVVDCTAETTGASADGFQQLDEWMLLAPFVLTGVCTTIGIVVFFGCGYAGFGSSVAYRRADDKELHRQLELLPLSKLRARAMEIQGAAKEERDEAINAASFGEKGLLVEFVFDNTCSKERRIEVTLNKMTLVELFDKAAEIGMPQQVIDGAANDKLEPRDRLVGAILAEMLNDTSNNPTFDTEEDAVAKDDVDGASTEM